MDEKQRFEMEKKKENLKSCRICSKEFSSGNALGGHMRVHTQGSSSHQHSSSVDNGGGCSVCRKHFDSLRSLFGHMRCHPGRHWREILALQIVPRWGVTGKRGRGGAFPAPESDVLEGARDLMFFAGKKQSPSSSSSVDDGIGGDKGLGFGSGYESELDSDGNFFAVQQEREEEQKLKNPIVDPNANPGSGQDRFRCVTCGKEFLSYQALGGHRSKHYKERNGSGPGPENGSSREEEKELRGKFVHDPLHWVGPTPATWAGPVEGGMRLQLADLNLPAAARTSTRDGYGVLSP